MTVAEPTEKSFTVLDVPANQTNPRKIQLTMSTDLTVLHMKQEIFKLHKYPPSHQQLILKGQVLEDSMLLSSLDLQEKSMILLKVTEVSSGPILQLSDTAANPSYVQAPGPAPTYGPQPAPYYTGSTSSTGYTGGTYGYSSGYSGGYSSGYGGNYGSNYGGYYGSMYGSGHMETGRNNTGFVGLSNQGATCYMNSLIQSLYMTPEFRQAVYRWDFEAFFRRYLEELSSRADDKKKESPDEVRARKEQHSIPLQLQKLFVRLQISDQRAVKTKDLTKSFGWSDEEAFTQHDVQELCRVLFDALEIAFKGTAQQSIITDLYQGEMKDYVVCKECGFESARTDKYLDVPLNIKAFGESKAVASLEEALEKFIQAEVLTKDNQYHCEKCNKKVDAVKGLKFTSFPKILTMQLKRFDFDYQTMRRIKLNDRVTFPKYLDLNPFIEGGEIALRQSGSHVDTGALPADPNVRPVPTPDKKHYYELFAILIHRGSALGGHYYAYIKSFENDRFFEFNDSQVSPLDDADLEKAYGDVEQAPSKWSGQTAYSNMYKSSANAYMLMYRRIEAGTLNTVDEAEIHPSVHKIIERENEEAKRKREEAKAERSQRKFPVHYEDREENITVRLEDTVQDFVSAALAAFHVAPGPHVRVRHYQAYTDLPGRPLDPATFAQRIDVQPWNPNKHFIIETKGADEEWDTFDENDTGVRLRVWRDGVLGAPVYLFLPRACTLAQLRAAVERRTGVRAASQRLLQDRYAYSGPEAELLRAAADDEPIRNLRIIEGSKLYLEHSALPEHEWHMADSPLYQEIVRIKNQIEVRFNKLGSLDYSEKVGVDKREPLRVLRAKMAAHLGVAPDTFKILRSQYAATEMKDDDASSIHTYNLYDNKVYLDKGQPSKPGEFMAKFLHYDPEGEEKMVDLWEMPVQESLTARELKVVLAARWAGHTPARAVDPALLRVREVGSSAPSFILRDDKPLKDSVRVRYAGKAFCLQVLSGPDPVTKDNEMAIFIQVVHPAKYALGRLVEVVVPSDIQVADLKKLLEEKGLVREASLAKPTYDMGVHDVDILSVPALEWDRKPHMAASNAGSISGSPYYLREADMLIVKEKNEEWKTLSAEEKAELKKLKKRQDTTTSRYRYREEALKIQQDTD